MDHPARVLVFIVAVVIAFAAFWPTVPVTWTGPGGGDKGLYLDDVSDAGQEVNELTPPDQMVFTITVNYYAFGDRGHPYTSRVWFLISPYRGQVGGVNQSNRHDNVYANLTAMFRNGSVGLVVMTPRTGHFIRNNVSLHEAFSRHYCRVNVSNGFFYDRGVNVYRWHDSQPVGCNSTITARWHTQPSRFQDGGNASSESRHHEAFPPNDTTNPTPAPTTHANL